MTLVNEFKPTHTTRYGEDVAIIPNPVSPSLPIALFSDGTVCLVKADAIRPIPDEPEPPAVLHWCGEPEKPDATIYRYVRADEGDVVIPAAVAKAFLDTWAIPSTLVSRRATQALLAAIRVSRRATQALLAAIREQRGGAS